MTNSSPAHSPQSQPVLLLLLLKLLLPWKGCFCRSETFHTAQRQAITQLIMPGPHTISHSLEMAGRQDLPWNPDYRLFSAAPWTPEGLAKPVLSEALQQITTPYISSAIDATHFVKTGQQIPHTSVQIDPLSPTYHRNFIKAQRVLHVSLIVPQYGAPPTQDPLAQDPPPAGLEDGSVAGDPPGTPGEPHVDLPARALPILLRLAPPAKKPGKGATPAELAAYKQAREQQRLPVYFQTFVKDYRRLLNEAGGTGKPLVLTADNGFCNRKCLSEGTADIVLIARARENYQLCFPAPSKGTRKYAIDKFTPKSVRKDPQIPWQQTWIFHGGQWRVVRYKVLDHVLWQGGTLLRQLRLFVIAPVPYRTTKKGRRYYRKEAYLLCTTDTEIPVAAELQAYFDHWQIEVAHKELKSGAGAGQAQVRNQAAVERMPAFIALVYSLLQLAALKAYGPARDPALFPDPAWRQGKRHSPKPRRCSFRDLSRQLRREVATSPELVQDLGLDPNLVEMLLVA
jgi:hypothetical protein